MAARGDKQSWSQTLAIPGMHPPLVFSVIVLPAVFVLWLLRSPDAPTVPSEHLAILGVVGLLGIVAASTSRCNMVLKHQSPDVPLVVTKVWRILGIPLRRTQMELRGFSAATATEQLDLIGFFFFFLFALLLTWIILLVGAVVLVLIFIWVIAAPGLMVLRKLTIVSAFVSEGALSEPGSFLDSVKVGKSLYAVRLMGMDGERLTLCKRLDAKNVSRVLRVLDHKASLELVKLPPEFA